MAPFLCENGLNSKFARSANYTVLGKSPTCDRSSYSDRVVHTGPVPRETRPAREAHRDRVSPQRVSLIGGYSRHEARPGSKGRASATVAMQLAQSGSSWAEV